MGNITKTMGDVKSLLDDVTYKSWSFNLEKDAGGYLLSVVIDSDTSANILSVESKYLKPLAIRKWYISRFATDTEVVRTAYKAVMYIDMFIVEHAQHINMGNYMTKMSDYMLDNSLVKSEVSSMVDAKMMLSCFEYKDWRLVVDEQYLGLMLHLVFDAADNDSVSSNDIETQHCRKFFYDFTNFDSDGYDELYLTVQYAIRTAEEHECNEQFKYKGVSIYNPHINIAALTDFVSKTQLDHG